MGGFRRIREIKYFRILHGLLDRLAPWRPSDGQADSIANITGNIIVTSSNDIIVNTLLASSSLLLTLLLQFMLPSLLSFLFT